MNLFSFFKKPNKETFEVSEPMKKILIVGLGNIGEKYNNTRHNIGFKILDYIAHEEALTFESDKLGAVSYFRYKGRTFVMLKPSTYMNLSGKAVKYWMTKENISLENVLIICDDLNIPFGTFRVKAKGSAGGHNGLKDINEKLNTQQYARFRFGVSNSFSQGRQVDYVLGQWSKEETSELIERLEKAKNLVKSFGTAGLKHTMNDYNGQ